MRLPHLSDEAVAACADGLLRGAARERARAHIAQCPECAHAVAIQREAVWALRAAPPPALPSGLLDRLRQVPMSAPVTLPPTGFGPDGATVIAARPGMVAAFAATPVRPDNSRARTALSHRARTVLSHRKTPLLGTVMAVAVAGVLAAGSAAHAAGPVSGVPIGSQAPARVQPADSVGGVAPALVKVDTGR